MNTIRSLLQTISAYIDTDNSHYFASSIILPLEGEGAYHFSTVNDKDTRNEIQIILGDTFSTFKKGHIHVVHCCLPREFITSALEKYRDHRDPSMYKFWLPERVFNSILSSHPVDIKILKRLHIFNILIGDGNKMMKMYSIPRFK